MTFGIELDPTICHGKPIIKGTRILVSTILGAMAGGDSITDILEDYPTLQEKDITCVLEFASELSLFEDTPYEAHAS